MNKWQGLIHAAETEHISYLNCCIELRVSLMKEQFTRIHIVFHEWGRLCKIELMQHSFTLRILMF